MRIKIGTINQVVALSKQLPEFVEPHEAAVYKERMADKVSLVLVAWIGGEPVGFKVGYERNDYFYSWMGGVLPSFRQKGIAKALADEQEAWAVSHGFDKIVFKTRNCHKKMLTFALNNGFDIIGHMPKAELKDHRILLSKRIK